MIECRKAFNSLKEQLAWLLTLQPPILGEPLTLYVMSIEGIASVVLISKVDEARQRSIYYHSHALQEVEINYPPIKKLALAIVTKARWLRPYFEPHIIMILMRYPILQVLRKPDVSGCLMKWAIELSEFKVSIVPTQPING